MRQILLESGGVEGGDVPDRPALGSGGGLALIGTDDIVRAGTGIYATSIGKGLREAVEYGDREVTSNGTELLVA